ncbi:MAG: dTDP-glucose pyrophosphorylase [Parvicella sp.]|jgi:dTDP-glucose pyrophosphorylase
MNLFEKHLISTNSSIKDALILLDQLAADAILFVVDENRKLLGSLTDGDVRRGLLRDVSISDSVNQIIQSNPKFVRKGEVRFSEILEFRAKSFVVIPVLDSEDTIINVINFRYLRSYLPIDAVVMAGGKGTRLKPLTDKVPKPLLKVGEKAIITHNIDRLKLFGIDKFWITINYLGQQIVDALGSGSDENFAIQYVREDKPLGTLGSISYIEDFTQDYVLLTNSDVLTNLDYEHFFMEFLQEDADLAVATIPYEVKVPYAVMETEGSKVVGFKEKPTYTYYSNGGIYLMKRSVLELVPKGAFYNATDLMEELINKGKKVTSYPLVGYWLDIGKHEDFEKAQVDIKHIKF